MEGLLLLLPMDNDGTVTFGVLKLLLGSRAVNSHRPSGTSDIGTKEP